MKYLTQLSSDLKQDCFIWTYSASSMNIANIKITVVNTDQDVMHHAVKNMVVMAFRERRATNKIIYNLGCTTATHFF